MKEAPRNAEKGTIHLFFAGFLLNKVCLNFAQLVVLFCLSFFLFVLFFASQSVQLVQISLVHCRTKCQMLSSSEMERKKALEHITYELLRSFTFSIRIVIVCEIVLVRGGTSMLLLFR